MLLSHRGGRLWSAFAAFGLALGVTLSSGPAAAQPAASPDDVQAAYVYRFLSFVEWPPRAFASPTAPMVIGVAGSDRMFELLSGIVSGRPAQGRPVEVRRLAKPDQRTDVQLVFVGKEAWGDLPGWATWAREHPTVVTTDAPQGIELGATLAFVQTGQRVRFIASVPAAEKSGVKLSARLLAVAERVVGSSP